MFKVLVEGCEPTKGSKYSAAVDLYASEDIVIGAGETAMVGLGVCIDEDELISMIFAGYPDLDYEYTNEAIEQFMTSHYLQLEPRSSLRVSGLIVGTGIIDLDYRKEIKLVIHNTVKAPKYCADASGAAFDMTDYKPFKIPKGQKIAQILLQEHKTYYMGISTEVKRTGGFGSTGK
jgi:dUTPase